MSGKDPQMNSLTLRKRLLIAESELNRAQLAEEWHTMAEDVRLVAGKAKTISTVALAAALLVAGLVQFRRAMSARAGQKSSWWQTLLQGAKMAVTLWSQFRPPPKS
jgi:hypothetical protein